MAKSKAYEAAAAKIEDGKFYTPTEAVALAKETATADIDGDATNGAGLQKVTG